jgi:hypothetical protein
VTVRERVEKGAALLDEEKPGWRESIDLGRLDMMSPWRCVLGQVFETWDMEAHSGYTLGLAALFDGDEDEDVSSAIEHGFEAPLDEGVRDYGALHREWLDHLS